MLLSCACLSGLLIIHWFCSLDGCLAQQCLLVLRAGLLVQCSAENRFVPHHSFRSLFVLLCKAAASQPAWVAEQVGAGGDNWDASAQPNFESKPNRYVYETLKELKY